jgi:hypothetical protein
MLEICAWWEITVYLFTVGGPGSIVLIKLAFFLCGFQVADCSDPYGVFYSPLPLTETGL